MALDPASEPVESGRKKRKRRFRYRFQQNTRRVLVAAVGVWLVVIIAIGVVTVSDDFARPLGDPLIQYETDAGASGVERVSATGGILPSGGAAVGEPVCGGPSQ